MNCLFCKRLNLTKFPHMHSWRNEDMIYTRLWLKMKIFDFQLGVSVNTSREDKQNRSRAVFKEVFVFFCKTVHFSYLLHPEGCHRGELCRAALEEGSNGPQRKSLALLSNNPVSAALSRVSGYHLLSLSPASNCNFSVVEKRDSFFSEPLSAISRQCCSRQFLRSRGSRYFKETL